MRNHTDVKGSFSERTIRGKLNTKSSSYMMTMKHAVLSVKDGTVLEEKATEDHTKPPNIQRKDYEPVQDGTKQRL